MKRPTLAILVCIFALLPTRAGADDGGWLDWLWKWDQRFWGLSGEIHLLCLDDRGRRVTGCEEWFANVGRFIVRKPIKHQFQVLADPATNRYDTLQTSIPIRHEIDFRFGYYHNYGKRYDPPNPEVHGAINVWTPQGMYHYHVNKTVAVGGGAGYVIVYGDRFEQFSRGLLTGALTIYPYKALSIRPELNYITGGFTAADFGDTGPAFTWSKEKEFSFRVLVGFDLRRIPGR